MVPVSVVIITKNEAEVIVACIAAAKMITDNIIIVDNDSTDETVNIAARMGCCIYQEKWDGYGANKNKGIRLARYDWILSIDADEIPDEELILALHNLQLNDNHTVYDIKFQAYFGKKLIRYGNWGRDHHIRLFNRNRVKWSETNVHETLIFPKEIKRKRIKGCMLHYSVKDRNECNNKAVYYARLCAEKYAANGKSANVINLYLSPVFSFFKNYIILLGFLDGKEGWHIAKMIFKNKWLKYHYLNHMESGIKKEEFIKANLTVEC
jgi:hypothetical protein